MTDPQEQSSVDDQINSDDETLPNEDHDAIDIVVQDEDDVARDSGTPDPIANGQVSRRYREILRERVEDASDEGSIDAAPRRAGSPIDSLLSVPDDTPSIQVCTRCC